MEDIFEGTGQPLGQADFTSCLGELGTDEASLWSVLKVETRGFGFFNDRRPKILFERHVFSGRTGGKYDAAYPDISNPVQGGYSGGPAEYGRLKRAMALNRTAALESASWGLGQVMGFNATGIGYANCDAMVAAFAAGEAAQLEGCVRFIKSNDSRYENFKNKNWARFAYFYNGKKYFKNKYDVNLRDAHTEYTRNGCPSVELRRTQALLTYLGFDPRGIDGVIGQGTRNALASFRAAYKLDSPMLPPDNAAPADYNDCLQATFEKRLCLLQT